MITITVSKAEFDKLVRTADQAPFDMENGNTDWRGPFMVTWADSDTVESVQIVGTMIVIVPEGAE